MKRILLFLVAAVIALTAASVNAQTPTSYGTMTFRTESGKTVAVSIDENLNFSWAGGELKINGTSVSETIQLADLTDIETTDSPVANIGIAVENRRSIAYFDDSGCLTVKAESLIKTVTVYGINGQLLLKQSVNADAFICYNTFPAGVYIIQVDDLPALKVIKK